MQLAFISDIHANLEALEAVLPISGSRRLTKSFVSATLSVTAQIQMNAQRSSGSSTVLLGNHDAAAVNLLATHHFNSHAKIAIEWTAGILKNEVKSFLLSLPLSITRDGLTLVHSTPYEPNMWYYITSLEEAAFNFQYFETIGVSWAIPTFRSSLSLISKKRSSFTRTRKSTYAE